jgi:hypothetical protein
MWCIGVLNADYRRRMYDLLELYARPYCEHEPVICIDEKSKQLLKHARPPLSIKPGAPPKDDYEYVRAGTCNVFVALEPKGKRRVMRVTQQRTKPEFVAFVQRLLERTYSSARKVHLVLDNLNTHFRSSFEGCWDARRRLHCCAESSSTTRPSTPAGSTWPRSKSASWSASASHAGSWTVHR